MKLVLVISSLLSVGTCRSNVQPIYSDHSTEAGLHHIFPTDQLPMSNFTLTHNGPKSTKLANADISTEEKGAFIHRKKEDCKSLGGECLKKGKACPDHLSIDTSLCSKKKHCCYPATTTIPITQSQATTTIPITQSQDADIVYKYTRNYDLVWNDTGTGGANDVSIWRVNNLDTEYCSIGDVAQKSYNRPSTNAIIVTSKKPGVLVSPASFTKIYLDKRSGAPNDLAVYKMNPPSGYRCLGGVTMGNYDHEPDMNNYCCIKNEYTVQGHNVWVYNDKGTGAHTDLSLWEFQRGTDINGIEGGNFVPNNNHGKPANGYLLKEDRIKVVNIRDVTVINLKPLNLHEVSDIKEVWTDKGSGAYDDVSIWRAEKKEGYYSIGDIAVGSHNKPSTAFVLKPTDSDDIDSLRPPVSYQPIWNDKGSGASNDVTIWRPICPSGYVSLGYVATDGKQPEHDECYCVMGKYASSGNWHKVLDDSGSGASEDVTIYEAVGATDKQQRSKGFGAIASHDGHPGKIYLLNTDSINYIAEPPIQKIEIVNVNYEMNAARIIKTHPGKSGVTTVVNNGNIQSEDTRVITYSIEKSLTWKLGIGLAVGVSVEVEAGIPYVVEGTITVTATVTTSFEIGETKTRTETDQIGTTIYTPAYSRVSAWVSYNKYKTNIPYTADIKKTYYDGTTSICRVSGVYKGVNVAEVLVVHGKPESIHD